MVKLRKFSLSDLEEVMEIERASFPYQEAFPKSLFGKYYRDYPDGFIVAENENEITGYTIGRPPKQSLRDATGQAKNEVAEIISLAVNPKWRRKGVGTKLTNFLIDHFKEGGLKEIFLHVRTKNKASISFYQKLGFKILETIKNYFRNGDDAYVMKNELGE